MNAKKAIIPLLFVALSIVIFALGVGNWDMRRRLIAGDKDYAALKELWEKDATQYNSTNQTLEEKLDAQSQIAKVQYGLVWDQAYTQAAWDYYYKCPQVVVQRDYNTVSIWKKGDSAAIDDFVDETIPLIPEEPTLPKKSIAKKH